MADDVAVFHFFRGALEEDLQMGEVLQVHASIPFVSTAHSFRFPIQHETVDPRYRETILRDVWTLGETVRTDRFSSGRINPNDHASIRSPRKHRAKSVGVGGRYRTALKDCAQIITERLGLDEYIFRFLFSLKDKVQHIQICTDELDIPWDWVYSSDHDSFLCELFGVGVTYPESAQPVSRYEKSYALPVTALELATSKYSAILFANVYSNSAKPIVKLSAQADRMGESLKHRFGSLDVDVVKDADRSTVLDRLEAGARTLRLICLSGHFTERGFATADGKHLAPDALLRLFDRTSEAFLAEPLVVLNGCRSSGNTRPRGFSRIDVNRSVARAFLDLGAAACVVTSTDVRLQYATQFVNTLLENLLVPGTTIGKALMATRNSMNKDECYEWATYHLLGDPTYLMVREG